jgi:hypothetical protein
MGDKNDRITAGEKSDQAPAKISGLSGGGNGYTFDFLNNAVFQPFVFMDLSHASPLFPRDIEGRPKTGGFRGFPTIKLTGTFRFCRSKGPPATVKDGLRINSGCRYHKPGYYTTRKGYCQLKFGRNAQKLEFWEIPEPRKASGASPLKQARGPLHFTVYLPNIELNLALWERWT